VAVVLVGEIRNMHKILFRKFEEKGLGDVGMHGRIILRWNLRK
jgi:hypothetical protein